MISLKEVYFNRIVSGEKKYEFRRVFAKDLNEGFLCAVYVSSPVQAVKGVVEFDAPRKMRVNEIFRLMEQEKYPFAEGVKEYFKGKEVGYVLPVKKVRVFDKPISLEELRKIKGGFVPPQSFYCLDKEGFGELRELVFSHLNP